MKATPTDGVWFIGPKADGTAHDYLLVVTHHNGADGVAVLLHRPAHGRANDRPIRRDADRRAMKCLNWLAKAETINFPENGPKPPEDFTVFLSKGQPGTGCSYLVSDAAEPELPKVVRWAISGIASKLGEFWPEWTGWRGQNPELPVPETAHFDVEEH